MSDRYFSIDIIKQEVIERFKNKKSGETFEEIFDELAKSPMSSAIILLSHPQKDGDNIIEVRNVLKRDSVIVVIDKNHRMLSDEEANAKYLKQ